MKLSKSSLCEQRRSYNLIYILSFLILCANTSRLKGGANSGLVVLTKKFLLLFTVISLAIISYQSATLQVVASTTTTTTTRRNIREDNNSQIVKTKQLIPRSLAAKTKQQTSSNTNRDNQQTLFNATPASKTSPPGGSVSSSNNNACPPVVAVQSDTSGSSSSGTDFHGSTALPSSSEQLSGSFGFTQANASEFVKPVFYTLRLKLDPNKKRFSGQVMISVEIMPPNLSDNNAIQQQQQQNNNNSSIPDGEGGDVVSQIGQDKNGELGYRFLTLHVGANIQIKKAFYVYTTRGSIQIPATKIGKSAENELLTLDYYPNVITSGQGLLLIVYSGLVNETESHGLFVHHSQKLSKRYNNNSTTFDPYSSGGFATQMQPNFARRLLPSWDEPHLKARFNLIVVLPFKNYVTLSNMPVKRKSISLSCSGEPLQEIEFYTTPTMSTYLLTLVIGRFDYIELVTQNNIRIRAYVYSNLTTTNQSVEGNNNNNTNSMTLSTAAAAAVATTQPGQAQAQKGKNFNPLPVATADLINVRKQNAELALDVAIKTFDLLETWLGVKYPLNKFDMVALRDFDNGGMENWGLSLFRESYFLYDSNSAHTDIQLTGGRARSRKIEIPLIIAHEIIHQWFGNLVTAKSWTFLWLNEGFAQLLMYDVASTLIPDEFYWNMFVEDIRQSAMHEDELLISSRALEFELTNSNEQLSLFDKITYNKGAMVVRMLQSLLGRQHFIEGLKHYLLKHSYDSVTSHDLWVALEESGSSASSGWAQEYQLEQLMSSWLIQEGFPLVSVQIQENTLNGNYRLKLSQERFTLMRLQSDSQLNNNNKRNNNNNNNSDDSSSDNNSYINSTEFANHLETLKSAWIWSMPIFLSSELNPSPSEETLTLDNRKVLNGFVMTERTATISLPKANVGQWFKLNYNATGYFRIDYITPDRLSSTTNTGNNNNNNFDFVSAPDGNHFKTVDMLERFKLAIKKKQMLNIDRFNLVDDLFAMVKSGRRSTVYYLRYLIETFDDETEILVMRSIIESLKRIKALVSNSDLRLNSLFDRYVLEYLRRVSDSHNRLRLLNLNQIQSIKTTSASYSSANQVRDGQVYFNLSQQEQKFQKQANSNSRIQLQQEELKNYNNNDNKLPQQLITISQLEKQNNQLKEIDDLISTSRVHFNDKQAVERAADLFTRNFRQSSASNNNNNNIRYSPSSASASSASSPLVDLGMSASTTSNAQYYGAAASSLHLTAAAHQTESSSHSAGSKPTAVHNKAAATPTTATTTSATLFESMDREMRASIYSGALLMSATSDSDLTPEFELNEELISVANSNSNSNNLQKKTNGNYQQQQKLTNNNNNNNNNNHYYSDSQPLIGNSLNQASSSSYSINGMNGNSLRSQGNESSKEEDVFLKLLKAYETSLTSSDRFAISTALGTTSSISPLFKQKQIKLLNLTLFDNYFKLLDSYSLLDSMARTKNGRLLIWEQLCKNSRLIERKQLLSIVLKSLSHGLIETNLLIPQQESFTTTTTTTTNLSGDNEASDVIINRNTANEVEKELRALYQSYAQDYGKLIGQLIEIVRINSFWFKRDHDGLVQYLNMFAQLLPA